MKKAAAVATTASFVVAAATVVSSNSCSSTANTNSVIRGAVGRPSSSSFSTSINTRPTVVAIGILDRINNVRGGSSNSEQEEKKKSSSTSSSSRKKRKGKNNKKKQQQNHQSSSTKEQKEEETKIDYDNKDDDEKKEEAANAVSTDNNDENDKSATQQKTDDVPFFSTTSTKTKKNDNDNKESSQQQQQQHHDKKHHHHHHHRRRQNKIIEEIIDTDDYYVVLGVSKTSTTEQIKKAYRKRAVMTHPDKMPGDGDDNRIAFDKVSEAYDVLSDETKRNVYNRFGKTGLEQHQQQGGVGAGHPFSGTTAEEIFRSFFGGSAGGFGGGNTGGSTGRQQQQPINRTVRYQLEVTLEELYEGSIKSVIVTTPNQSRHRHNPFYQEQDDADTTRRRKNVEVHIPRGSTHGQSIIMSGEMDTIPNATPGDIIFILSQRSHPIFTRKNHDLAIELTISLKDAICGFTRSITHINGKQITIQSATTTTATATTNSKENEKIPMIIHDGDVQVLKGYGMPKNDETNSNRGAKDYGDLYIQFKVEMPKSSTGPGTTTSTSTPVTSRLTVEERKELERLLEKLNGSSSKSSFSKSSSSSSRSSKSISSDSTEESSSKSNDDDDDEANKIVVKPLEKANVSDFGRASGSIHNNMKQQQDDHHEDERRQQQQYYQHHHHRSFFPFGSSSGSQFYYSFGGGGGGNGNDDDNNNDDDYGYNNNNNESEDVQCAQM